MFEIRVIILLKGYEIEPKECRQAYLTYAKHVKYAMFQDETT